MSEMPASTTVPLRSGQAYDAVIVGARAAGAATALLLARAGLRVLVIDRGAYGTDTLSTHALMRGGVVQLHKWGLLSALEDTPAIRWTSFCYPDVTLRIPIKPSTQAPSLLAPRRYLLDRILVDAARGAGRERCAAAHPEEPPCRTRTSGCGTAGESSRTQTPRRWSAGGSTGAAGTTPRGR